jgi:ribonucleotide monophosphatase NagD (HAD superfamily)
MVEEALRGLDVTPADCLMIGDRLMTDIAMAADAGMASCLVLTGDPTREQSEALPAHRQPTYVVDRVDELLPATVWAERGWTAA